MDFMHEFELAMKNNGVSEVSEEARACFSRFTDHLLEVNQKTNLTAIRDIPSIVTKHYIDSLLVSPHIPQNARILDLGCGPGFPSIPLAITRRDLEIVSLDSTAKKIAFVQESVELLGLKNLTAISGRAEDREIMKTLGKFDVVVSRAVAGLNVLCELCVPYMKIGGVMLAMKGARIREEVNELLSGRAVRELGVGDPEVLSWDLVCNEEKEMRGVVRIKREKPCKDVYPRAYAQILKKPL